MSPIFFVLAHKLKFTQPSLKELNDSETSAKYDIVIIVYILITSVMTFLGQVFMSKAFQLEKSSIIATFNYTGTLCGFVIDLFFFKVKLHATDFIGCGLIISVLLSIALLKAFGWLK